MYQPFVSVVCPTSDRRKFIPMLLHYFESQTYPIKKMELLILDDGLDPIEDLVKTKKYVKYSQTHYQNPRGINEKKTIATMRNILNAAAKGDIIVCMDDDDFYPPERVEHAVETLQIAHNKYGCEIAGCSSIPIFIADEGFFISTANRGESHTTAGAMAYSQEYLKNHHFDKTKRCAEEASFTCNFQEPMVALDPKKTIVCINHGTNTFDKKNMIGPATLRFKPLDLNTIFRDKKATEFYTSMRNKGGH